MVDDVPKFAVRLSPRFSAPTWAPTSTKIMTTKKVVWTFGAGNSSSFFLALAACCLHLGRKFTLEVAFSRSTGTTIVWWCGNDDDGPLVFNFPFLGREQKGWWVFRNSCLQTAVNGKSAHANDRRKHTKIEFFFIKLTVLHSQSPLFNVGSVSMYLQKPQPPPEDTVDEDDS